MALVEINPENRGPHFLRLTERLAPELTRQVLEQHQDRLEGARDNPEELTQIVVDMVAHGVTRGALAVAIESGLDDGAFARGLLLEYGAMVERQPGGLPPELEQRLSAVLRRRVLRAQAEG